MSDIIGISFLISWFRKTADTP